LNPLPVHRERLANGLTLLVREAHTAPLAEVQVWVDVGSADERDFEAGLAHFHEHMLFKGTRRRGVGEVAGEVEGVGGHINAFTSFDSTVYHATLPGEHLGVGIDVLADAVLESVFDPAEIDREIEVVLEEIRRSEDSPHHVLSNAVFAEVYQVHPYRLPILGPPESVAGFDRERVVSFFERWYGPERMAVVVAGDVDLADVRDRVSEAFGKTQRKTARRERPVEPGPARLRGLVLEKPFERASLDLCCVSVGLTHPDAPLLDLVAFVLGEGESSRLTLRVKEQAELVDRVDAYSYTPLDPGLFGVTADLDPVHALACIAACARELERVRHEVVSSDEIEKARANFLAGEWFERESVSGLARRLGSFHQLGGDPDLEARYLETLRTATPDDLLRAAREHIRPDQLSVGLLVPEEAGLGLGAADVEGAVRSGIETTQRTFAVPRRASAGDRRHTFDLGSGAKLHVLPSHDAPVVAVRAAFLGGLLSEDRETAGLTSFLTSMWTRGTQQHSSPDFARSIETLAADIDGFSGRNSLGLGLDCLADRLDASLDLFAEVLVEPAFAASEVDKERRETLAALERRQDRLGARAFDLFCEALYGEHPYAFPLLGTEASVPRFDADRVRSHHERLVNARNLVVAVAGDVEPEQIASALASRLAGLPSAPFEAPSPNVPLPSRERRERELRRARAQAHLVIGFPGLTVDDPDREALEVLSQLLAGQGGRLFLELRDRQSLAYTVSASNVEGVAPGFFSVYIATAPEKLDAARAGLFTQLERLLEEPAGDSEIEAARQHLVGSFAMDQQRCAARALLVSLDALYDLGADAHQDYVARVHAVGKEDLLRVTRRIIDLESYTLAVIRP